jgi:hypothetical protein
MTQPAPLMARMRMRSDCSVWKPPPASQEDAKRNVKIQIMKNKMKQHNEKNYHTLFRKGQINDGLLQLLFEKWQDIGWIETDQFC